MQPRHQTIIALLFIAACALSTATWSQKVYRCGSSYSQTPCPDAVAVDADDARSRAQKLQADHATVRNTATANTMEKARLKEEALAIAQSQPATTGKATKSKTASRAATKKKTSKKKTPEFFTAQNPAEK